jgi:hypothetical protein
MIKVFEVSIRKNHELPRKYCDAFPRNLNTLLSNSEIRKMMALMRRVWKKNSSTGIISDTISWRNIMKVT